MKFTATVKTADPLELQGKGLQAGQWINYCGARGRWYGVSRHGDVLIAWGASATKRFTQFAAVGKVMAAS